MNFKCTSSPPKEVTRVKEMKPGELFQYQNGPLYIKLDKKEIGQGLRLQWPDKHCVLLNVKLGTMRAVHMDDVVVPLGSEPMSVYTITKRQAFRLNMLRDWF